jgi:hypothetical protein
MYFDKIFYTRDHFSLTNINECATTIPRATVTRHTEATSACAMRHAIELLDINTAKILRHR